MTADHSPQHPDHANELKRLNRVAGQVSAIGRMIEGRRYCPDIIVQLRAARSALRAIESNILNRHMHACVADVFAEGGEQDRLDKIDELTKLFSRS